MDSRASPTPPTARPKNSSSSITSATPPSQQQQQQQQPQPGMPSTSRAGRGSTPTASRSASKLGDADRPSRAASKDSLKQKMLAKKDDTPQPSRAEEVRPRAPLRGEPC